MEKEPIKEWLFDSIGVSLMLVVLTILVVVIEFFVDILIDMSILIGWTCLVLLGIELSRKQLMGKYHISFWKWFILTFSPSILLCGVYIFLYIFVINTNHGDLLSEIMVLEIMAYMLMVVWGAFVGALVAGTLIIALIRFGVHVVRRKRKRM